MNRLFIKQNTISISILLFIVLFSLVHIMKPSILYKPDGSIREFGINSNQKTIVPIWGLTIVLAILSYLFVQFYLIQPQVWIYSYSN